MPSYARNKRTEPEQGRAAKAEPDLEIPMQAIRKTIRTLAMTATVLAGVGAAQAGEPALLNGPLGLATGASAPARWVSTGLTTIAFKFPKTYVACKTPLAQPGSACSTITAPAGLKINGLLQRVGGNCRCIQS